MRCGAFEGQPYRRLQAPMLTKLFHFDPFATEASEILLITVEIHRSSYAAATFLTTRPFDTPKFSALLRHVQSHSRRRPSQGPDTAHHQARRSRPTARYRASTCFYQ